MLGWPLLLLAPGVEQPCYVSVRSSVGLLVLAVTLKVFAWRLCCFTFH